MDAITQSMLISLGLLLVFMNGFFVASEFAIVKVRGTRIQELVQSGSRSARRAQGLIESMDEYLSATQLGITLASLALGWVGEPAFSALFEPIFRDLGPVQPVLTHSLAATSAFLLITFLHIVLGELAPKSMAIQRAESVLMWVAVPLGWFYKLTYPLIWVLNGAANWLIRALGVTPMRELDLAHSEEELRLILADSHAHGVLDRDKRQMLERVFDFANRSVRQVMVPSVEVIFLDLQKDLKENIEITRFHRHTRYLLCDGTLDRVVGIIHVKDLFWHQEQLGKALDLESIKRPVEFVPDSKYIKSQLAEFRRTRTHLAVVVDEFGATIGIVALEDVLEELVGEIQDEFDLDVLVPMIQKAREGKYMVHGRALLEEVENQLGVRLDDEENDTVGGHVMLLLGRTAEVGDEVMVAGGYQVRVVGMKGLQITDLIFEKIDPS